MDDDQLDPHAAWLRTQEAFEQLDEVDELLAQRRREHAGGAEWTPTAVEPVKPPVHREQSSHASSGRAPEPPQRAPQQPVAGVDWQATEVWVRGIVRAENRALIEGIGAAVSRLRGELRAEFPLMT